MKKSEDVERARKELAAAQSIALRRAKRAYTKLQNAKDEYSEAVMMADALGMGATDISRHLGVSETAIRLFVRRRKEKSNG